MIDWTKTVFTFPGQGSQAVGMGKDLAEKYPTARAIFQQADDILGFSLSTLCFDGPEADLNDTVNTQPALYTTSAAVLQVLREQLPQATPQFVAGHSMGEFSALYAAESISFADGLKLVRERGRLMKAAGEQQPGAMAALLGVDADQARDICAKASAETGQPVIVANDNCPGQLVISGDNAAIDTAMTLASQMGAKRVIKLAVSIAAHSPLMQPSADQFTETLHNTAFKTPTVPVYGNVDAAPLTTVEAIRGELTRQLTQSVRWTESVQGMIAAGAAHFIEIGSGDVLTGLLRRIDRSKKGIALKDATSLEQFVAEQA